jgi:hypothetical protein
MSQVQKINKSVRCAVVLVVGICASSLASAAEYTGAVAGIHLNPNIADRGACTMLTPTTVPGTPWFCNYKQNNPLYDQINSLLQQSAVNRLYCKIDTTTAGPDGYHRINWISCPAF